MSFLARDRCSAIINMVVLFILVAALLAQQPQPASVEGTIVQLGTNQPIARAVVQVIGDRPEPYTMETGADGKFQFPNLARGQYQIRVSRTGYMDGAFGQRGPNGRGRSLPLEAGQAIKDIRITMVPFAAISGRVYDDRGEPIANVNIRALKYSYQNGQVSLTSVKSVLTNDRGEYRLFWLPPGEYYVSAIASTSKVTAMLETVLAQGATIPVVIDHPPHMSPSTGEIYAPIYYPGTPDARTATELELRPGVDLSGIDFSLARVIPRKVRGIVVDGATGQPIKAGSLLLVPRNLSMTGLVPSRPTGDGTFEIEDVYPGSYFLVAMTNVSGGNSRLAGGRAPLEIGNSDLQGIVVVVSPSIDIAATIEGLRAAPPAGLYPSIALRNESMLTGRAATAYGSFKNAAEFSIDNVIEGDYRLQITDVPSGMYVKSARFGAVDALNDTLHVDSRTTERLAVVLGSDGGQVEGTVTDRNRMPSPNASIVLVPINMQQRADLYKKATADESGRFQFRDIPPGDYLVFAWEDVDESVWRDPNFIRRNEASGRRVHIGSNSRETIEVAAIPFSF